MKVWTSLLGVLCCTAFHSEAAIHRVIQQCTVAIPQRSTLLDLRGGSNPTTPPGGDFFSQLGPLVSSVREFAEPILKDPNGKIFGPAQALIKERAKEVQSRQLELVARPQIALTYVISKPLKLIRLSLTAIVIAEVLDRLEVLEDPVAAKVKIRNAFHKARIEFHETTQQWWMDARQPGGWFHTSTWRSPAAFKRKIATMDPKHQFTIGVGIGMIFSPFVWSIGKKLFQSAALVYVFSEVNDFLRNTTGKSAMERVSELVHGNMGEALENTLESLRVVVRRTVSDPTLIIELVTEALDKFIPDDGLTPNTKRGLLSGLTFGIVVV